MEAMTRRFLPAAARAELLATGKATVRTPMKPPIPSPEACGGLTVSLRDIPDENRWYLAYEADRGEWGIEYRPVPQFKGVSWLCPTPPGAEYWVPEPWGRYIQDIGDVRQDRWLVFRDDGDSEPSDNGITTGWRSAGSMPKELARLFVRVSAVRVERVEDVWYWETDFRRINNES